MMKRTGIWLALALGLASHGVMAKTVNVVSSFSVLGDMAQQIGGEHVHVDTLVGPDGDPHTFEPSPKRQRAAEQSRCGGGERPGAGRLAGAG
ncbi:metal ABC transporter substrate-binding protein [Escherichia coli]